MIQTIETIQEFSEKVNDVSETSIAAFKYIFSHFKKGIFVKICGNRVRYFVCFDNKYYENDWHANIDFGDFNFSSDIQKPKHWYANNYLVRYEKPFKQSMIGRVELFDMFISLCQTFDIPDIEFFINRRDFPLLRRDGRHPYAAIYGQNGPILKFPARAILFSMVSSEKYLDIPIPTPDDWSRVKRKDFSETRRTGASVFVDDFSKDWRNKKNIAVFRGSNTGSNFGEIRIKLCETVKDDPRFDAKLTSISPRYQIIDGVLTKPNIAERTRDLLGTFLSLKEQSEYRYIIHVAGHVQSFRLAAELATFSTILLVESDTRVWFETELKPWKHFIPVAKDLSNLFERLEWCHANLEKCAAIAQNARAFYDEKLTETGCLRYLYHLVKDRETKETRKAVEKIDTPLLGISRSYLKIMEKGLLDYKRGRLLNTVGPNTRLVDVSGRIFSTVKTFTNSSAREAMIGFECINKLVQEIPNFLYTFEYSDGKLYQEYPENCISLQEYIKSQAFRFQVLLSIWKHAAIALEHAQTKYSFVHGNLGPENVLLHQVFPKDYDYIDSSLNIWRCRTEHPIPIFIDYSNSRAISSEHNFFLFGKEISFQKSIDCSSLVVKSIRCALYYRRLSDANLKTLFDLFSKNFAASTLKQLIDTVHRREIFQAFKHPMELFDAVKDSNFIKVQGVEYNHYGKVAAVYSYPDQKSALVRRRHQQILSIITKNGYSERLVNNKPPARDICKGWKIPQTFDIKYLEALNMCIDLLTDGSQFQLTVEEKEQLYRKIEKILLSRRCFI